MKNRKILLPILLSMALVVSQVLPAVVAEASDDYDSPPECEVGDWTDITKVAAGEWHTVGLKSDGTVVAVGWNWDGQCNIGGWTDITQVAAGDYHTVGLKSEGTMVAVGDDDEGQCDVGGWTNTTQVTAGGSHTVGLKSDGTVVAVGYDHFGQCDVGGWTNITQVAAGGVHTVGLKSDGTVVAVGENGNGPCDVSGWTDITQVAAGDYHTVGLKSDGTVVAVGGTVLEDEPHGPEERDNGGVGGCFIATAAYGTPLAEEIQILRECRDEYLLTNPLGQALVDFYYRVSPPIAELITEHPGLKPIVRAGLLPAVAMSAVAVNTTPPEKIAIIGLLVLVSAALAIWLARRRDRGPECT
jgi:alpha-tubulin suppressor-like RCC1 family protein